MIFQNLEDLKAACAELSPRPGQQFEVGVFCGSYVTPVDKEYFEHLDRIRGESKKLKVVANAKEAVVNGTANSKELQIALQGAQVASNGEVVPSRPGRQPARKSTGKGGQRKDDEDRQPQDQMDMALHNFGDYTRR